MPSARTALAISADQIAARTAVDGVASAGPGRVPEGDPIVMLGGRDDVLGASGFEESRPIPRVEGPGRPGIEEIVVRCAAIGLLMVLCGRTAGDAGGVVVPLRVRVVR